MKTYINRDFGNFKKIENILIFDALFVAFVVVTKTALDYPLKKVCTCSVSVGKLPQQQSKLFNIQPYIFIIKIF